MTNFSENFHYICMFLANPPDGIFSWSDWLKFNEIKVNNISKYE